MDHDDTRPGAREDLEQYDESLAVMLASLRQSRPAAFEMGLAALQLAGQDTDVLEPYLAEHPAPGPEAADEDLVAWAERCRRFTAWLATDGKEVVRVDDGVRLEVVEVER